MSQRGCLTFRVHLTVPLIEWSLAHRSWSRILIDPYILALPQENEVESLMGLGGREALGNCSSARKAALWIGFVVTR